MTLAPLAVMEMKSDCRMMTHVSGSPVTNNKMAPTKPDPSSLQYSQFTAPMRHLELRSCTVVREGQSDYVILTCPGTAVPGRAQRTYGVLWVGHDTLS